MDTQKLIKEAKARFKHQENKIYLQEKWNSKLVVVSQGGMWAVTQEFLAFLGTAPDNTVVLDYYGNPLKVNTKQLQEEAWTVYNNVMTEWFTEYEELKNLR